MTDQLEGLLRNALTSDAEQAPLSTQDARHRVVGAAGVAVRARRRRLHAVTGSAVAAVLVAGSVTGLALQQDSGGNEAVAPAAPTVTERAEPDNPLDGYLSFRGVEVAVPKTMLRTAPRCDVLVDDAAWVDAHAYQARGFTMAMVDCAQNPFKNVNRLTFVKLDVAFRQHPAPQEGTTTLSDGITQVIRIVPERAVQLTVSSPDPERAQAIADSMTVLPADWSSQGCKVKASGDRPAVRDTAEQIAPAEPEGGRMCSYSEGWLETPRVLDRDAARLLAGAFLARPARSGDSCPEPEESWAMGPHLVVTFDEGTRHTRIWTDIGRGDGCDLATNDHGQTVRASHLSAALVAAFSHAPAAG